MQTITEILQGRKTIPSCGDLPPGAEKGLKNLFMQTANEFIQRTDPGKQFQIDDRNREVISGLWDYFFGLPGKYDTSKGLWLTGPPGTGKSALLYIFSAFMQKLRKGFRVYTANSIAMQFEQTGELDRYTANVTGYSGEPVILAIDEVGQEPRPSVHFGTRRNVIQYLLHTRYCYWQQTGLKTYFTTNLDMNDVEDYYGDAIRDRVPHMCNMIPMEGESRRK